MSDYDRIEKVIQHLESHFMEQPSLEDLAQIAGLSDFHFHRLFKRWAGITPKDFLKFLTINHAKSLLNKSRNLLTTSLESGLSGPGRLHDLFVTIEAVTPGEYKSKGLDVVIEYGIHESPFGSFLIGVTKRGICFLSFTSDLEELKSRWVNAQISENQASTYAIAKNLFQPGYKEPLSVLLMGTPFQIKVWEALLKIPEGQVLAYSDVAKIIDSPKAARAVGSAVGVNDIAYIIPCHRVIRESGVFAEYRWSGTRKKAILAWESSRATH